MSDPRTQAAPPDEAGHLGSQTVPEDVLEVPEADQPAQPPHLHRDVPPKRSGAGLGVVISMLIVVLVAVVIVWAYYYWGL